MLEIVVNGTIRRMNLPRKAENQEDIFLWLIKLMSPRFYIVSTCIHTCSTFCKSSLIFISVGLNCQKTFVPEYTTPAKTPIISQPGPTSTENRVRSFYRIELQRHRN